MSVDMALFQDAGNVAILLLIMMTVTSIARVVSTASAAAAGELITILDLHTPCRNKLCPNRDNFVES